MGALEHRIPPPVVALACGAIMWGIAWFTPVIGWPDVVRLVVAGVVALVAVGVAVAGMAAFRRAGTTVDPHEPDSATSLVRAGMYRVSRNPMYLGLALFLVAWAVFLSSPWALIGVAVFVAYITRFQIRPEERALAKLFGAEYEAYREAVRRWL